MRGGTLKGDIEEMVRLRREARPVTLTSRKESQELDIYSAPCFFTRHMIDSLYAIFDLTLTTKLCSAFSLLLFHM